MTIQIDTTEYEFAHGRKPRGTGTWAFFFDADKIPWWMPDATYAEAKKAAIKEGRRIGAFRIKVGS